MPAHAARELTLVLALLVVLLLMAAFVTGALHLVAELVWELLS